MIEAETHTKWLKIVREPRPANRKTDSFMVLTQDGLLLGRIHWFGRWRQYTFSPEANTVYEKRCLLDIAEFLQRLMVERYAEAVKA